MKKNTLKQIIGAQHFKELFATEVTKENKLTWFGLGSNYLLQCSYMFSSFSLVAVG